MQIPLSKGQSATCRFYRNIMIRIKAQEIIIIYNVLCQDLDRHVHHDIVNSNIFNYKFRKSEEVVLLPHPSDSLDLFSKTM